MSGFGEMNMTGGNGGGINTTLISVVISLIVAMITISYLGQSEATFHYNDGRRKFLLFWSWIELILAFVVIIGLYNQ